MNGAGRLKELSKYMDLEPAEDLGCQKLTMRQQNAIAVSSARLPSGRRIVMLKTLLTSACERDCNYCPFRAGRDYRRATLTPDEMAKAFILLHQAGVVQGLFLSSGVSGGGIKTQDKLLATAEILRQKHAFMGYLHLKLMPGAEESQIQRALELADRISINLEGPNTERLHNLAPKKRFLDELIEPMRITEQIRRSKDSRQGWKGRWPSMVTQFVVGAAGESDKELLSTTHYLHNNLSLRRAYFSAFNPVPDTPFENRVPTSVVRQNRLYQASFLLRDYGFTISDLHFEETGLLPEDTDPKTLWAQKNLSYNPIELNLASRLELLRIPGIGPKSVKAILEARRIGSIKHVEDLRHIGVNPKRALPFILLDGKRPLYQRSFF